MTMVPFVGLGPWVPTLVQGLAGLEALSSTDTLVLDADGEEAQLVGSAHVDGGGTKMFGLSSMVGWLPGPTITFAANSTLRVGVKAAASVDLTAGPPARATPGAAAFAVYRDLVGGTDLLPALTFRTDAMTAGIPFAVTQGDLLTIALRLSTTGGTPNVKMRCASAVSSPGFPAVTLVTAGPTYTNVVAMPNAILTFDDGTLGWLSRTVSFAVIDTASPAIGQTNILGNVFQLPFACEVDALAANVTASTSAADFALDLYATPLGAPQLLVGVAHDANVMGFNNRVVLRELATPQRLEAQTPYVVGVRQTTATAVTVTQRDVFDGAYAKPVGLGAECYGVLSTAGGTFVAQNAGKRRFATYVRLRAIDVGGPGSPRGLVGAL